MTTGDVEQRVYH